MAERVVESGPRTFGVCSGCGQPRIYEQDLATRWPDITYPDKACVACGLIPPATQLDFRPFIG